MSKKRVDLRDNNAGDLSYYPQKLYIIVTGFLFVKKIYLEWRDIKKSASGKENESWSFVKKRTAMKFLHGMGCEKIEQTIYLGHSERYNPIAIDFEEIEMKLIKENRENEKYRM